MRYYLLICSLLFSVTLQAVERRELLPENTSLCISFSNMKTILQRIEHSPFGLMWNDPKMDAFRNKQELATVFKTILTGRDTTSTKDDERSHLQWKELQFLQGEIVIGISLAHDKNKESDINLIAEMSEKDYKKSLEIDERLFRIDPNEPRLKKSSFQGVEIVSMHHRKTGAVQHWQAWSNETILIFNKRADLEKALVRLRKEKIENPQKEGRLQVYCPPSFFEYLQDLATQTMDPAIKKQGITAEVIAQAIGFKELGNASFVIDLEPKKCDIQMTVAQTGPRAGFWKLLRPTPAPRGKLLRYVPKDIYSYGVTQFDITALWTEVPVMIGKINPAMLSQFQTGLAAIPLLLQIDLDKDVFNNLDSLIVTYSRMQGLKSQDLFAIKLRNEDQMSRTLAKILSPESPLQAMGLKAMSQEEVHGTTIYTVPVPAKPVSAKSVSAKSISADAQLQNYAFAVVHSYLLIGDQSFVRSMITAKQSGQSFYATPAYVSLLKRTPRASTAYGYSDVSHIFEPVIQELHSSGMLYKQDVDLNTKGLNPFESFFRGLNLSKLPDAPFFTRFFGNGFTHTSFKNGSLQSSSTLDYKREKN